jgi:hypothetical protein
VEPLLVPADLTCGSWAERARQAASGLNAITPGKSPVTALLVDIRQVFAQANAPRLSSRELVHNLMELGQRPWSELLAGRPLTGSWLARRLRPYGVRPFLLRTGPTVARGYAREAHARGCGKTGQNHEGTKSRIASAQFLRDLRVMADGQWQMGGRARLTGLRLAKGRQESMSKIWPQMWERRKLTRIRLMRRSAKERRSDK